MHQEQPDDNTDISQAELKKLREYNSYVRLAWKLAVAKKQDDEDGTHRLEKLKKSPPFAILNPNTKKIIELMEEQIFTHDRFEANQRLPLHSSWTDQQVLKFYRENQIAQNILQNSDFQDFLQNNIKKTRNMVKMIDAVRRLSTLVNNVSYAYPIPPVNWIMMTVWSGLNLIAGVGTRIAQRSNPEVKNQKKLPGYVAKSGLGGAIAVGGLAASFSAGGGVLGPLIVAGSTGFVAVTSGVAFVRKIKELYREFKEKRTPPETYRWRVANKALACSKHGINTIFFVCITILAVIAVAAIVANPYGLAAVAGVLGTIAIAMTVASVANVVMKRYVQWKIKKIEKEHNITHEKKLNTENKLVTRGKKVVKELSVRFKIKQRENSKISLEPHVAQQANQPTNLQEELNHQFSYGAKPKNAAILHFKTENAVSQADYENLTKNSIKELQLLKKVHDPSYEAVTKYQRILIGNQGQTSFVVNVNSDKVVEQKPGTLDLGSKNRFIQDNIANFQNQKNEVEVVLSRDPSDRAIWIALDLNKKLAPLCMEPCGDVTLLLKTIDAAKVLDVELKLASSDRKLLLDNPDPKVGAYYKAVVDMSSKEFSKLIAKDSVVSGFRELGKIPADFEKNNRSKLK